MTPVIAEILLFVLVALLTIRKDKYLDWSYFSFDMTNTIRGIAILMIVMMHTGCFLPAFFGSSYFGGVGVALFLMVSAYGLNESYKRNGINHFWKKKLLRIWIPYVLFILFLTIIRKDFSRLTSLDFYLDILCLKTSYWFIAFLIYNYIIFWVGKKVGHNMIWLLLVVFGVLEIIFDDRIRAEQVLSFPIGLFLSEYKGRLSDYWETHKCNVAILSLLLAFMSGIFLFCQAYYHIGNFTEAGKLLLCGKSILALSILLIISILPPPLSVLQQIYYVVFEYFVRVILGTFYIIHNSFRQRKTIFDDGNFFNSFFCWCLSD